MPDLRSSGARSDATAGATGRGPLRDLDRSTRGTASTPPLTRAQENAASTAIAAIAFLVVTGETLPVGLIRDVADGLNASVAQVGLTVSGYALVAAVSGLPLTRYAARFDRRLVLVVCALTFGITQLMAALATDLWVFLGARGIAALTHGVYFAVATPAVVRLVRAEVKVRAASRVAVACSLALVLGTPLGTLMGEAVGWRPAMAVLGVVALALGLGVARLLPPLPPVAGSNDAVVGGVLATLRSRALAVVMLVTVVLVSAHFALFTYVAPYADDRLDVAGRDFSLLLLAYGITAVLGSWLAGRLAEHRPVSGFRVGAVVFIASLLGLWLASTVDAAPVGIVLFVVWGGTFSLLSVSTGLAVMRRTHGPRAETAFAVHGIAFQVGIVAGSASGSLMYEHGALHLVPLVGAGAGALVLALALWGGRAFRGGAMS
ncbi:MFS transporter [Nocardioides pacificus]